MSADAQRAGVPENAIPRELLNSDRDTYIDRVLEELIRRDNLPSLFILAVLYLKWSTNHELLSVVKQIVIEKKNPRDAAPRVWAGLQTSQREKLEKLWSEFLSSDDIDQSNITNPPKSELTITNFVKAGLVEALAECFDEKHTAETLLIRISFPKTFQPNFHKMNNPSEFWLKVCEKIESGVLDCDNSQADFKQLLEEAMDMFKSNPIFQEIYQEYFVDED